MPCMYQTFPPLPRLLITLFSGGAYGAGGGLVRRVQGLQWLLAFPNELALGAEQLCVES